MLATIHVALVAALTTLCLADEIPNCGGFPVYLSVTPAQPGCTDTVTLGATQTLVDSCWTANAPDFLDEPPDFHFDLASIDLWEPGLGCLYILIEIPFAREVGPLPSGPYSLSVYHTSTSPRHDDTACVDRITFDVTCCPEVPAEVGSLEVNVAVPGSELWLSWGDVAGANDYVVYGQDDPDGPFTRPIQTASLGSVGVGVPIATTPTFFVVAARNACGVGPRR
jgi:hypothetical protein